MVSAPELNKESILIKRKLSGLEKILKSRKSIVEKLEQQARNANNSLHNLIKQGEKTGNPYCSECDKFYSLRLLSTREGIRNHYEAPHGCFDDRGYGDWYALHYKKYYCPKKHEVKEERLGYYKKE